METVIVLPTGRKAAGLRATTRPLPRVGDQFADAIEDHHRELTRFAYRLCGDLGHAEEVVAEAYVRVWRQWRRGKIDTLLPYLRRTVANEAYSRHKRRLVERREQQKAFLPASEPFERQVDERDALWAALARLSSQQRVVVVLRVVEDMSEEETARMLGIPLGTVKSRLSRGLAGLRTMLEASHA